MRWFGESWGAPVCFETEHIETPLGAACGACTKLIDEGDQGFELPFLNWEKNQVIYYHRQCFIDILGIQPEAVA